MHETSASPWTKPVVHRLDRHPVAPVAIGGTVDVLFDRARLVVEIDGFGPHRTAAAFGADRQRQNRLVNAGYRVLRFTWWDLVAETDRVVREVREALVRGSRIA